jgi:hypothetical protein
LYSPKIFFLDSLNTFVRMLLNPSSMPWRISS